MSFRALLAMAMLGLAVPAANAQSAPAGKTVRTNGIDMHYRELGSGEPLLLLHGFGACRSDWDPLFAELSKRHRLIVADLRGHGGSSSGSVYTHRESAKDIAGLLDRLGLQRVRAMGISSGGMTLLHLATSQPQRIERMVLIGATSHFPEEARRIMRATSKAKLPPDVVQMFRDCAVRGEQQADELIARFHGFKDSYDDMNFTEPLLSTIRAPTLIVHGDRDEFFPVEIPLRMYGAIPNSQLWIVPGGGHVPIDGERSAEFLRVAEQFLGERNSGD